MNSVENRSEVKPKTIKTVFDRFITATGFKPATEGQIPALLSIHPTLSIAQWELTIDWMIRDFVGMSFPLPSQWSQAVREITEEEHRVAEATRVHAEATHDTDRMTADDWEAFNALLDSFKKKTDIPDETKIVTPGGRVLPAYIEKTGHQLDLEQAQRMIDLEEGTKIAGYRMDWRGSGMTRERAIELLNSKV